MTISKELKKKIDKQVKKLINAFKMEFMEVKGRDNFNDDRKVLFLNAEKHNKKPFYFGEGEEEEFQQPESVKEFASVKYKQDKILVFINYAGIYKGYFFHTTAENFLNSYMFYLQVVKQIAQHEYGHSFLTETGFDRYPKEVKSFLQKIGCDDIDEVPHDKKEQLKEIFRKSEYGQVDRRIKTIELMLVEKSLIEYHANYSVKIKIDKSLPIESLKLKIWEFKESLKEKDIWKKKIFQSQNFGIKELSIYFFFLLILTQNFHIFKVWEKLEEIFSAHELSELLRLFHFINTILRTIIRTKRNFDTITLAIYKLAEILDKID